jgi:hypothetical protein
MKVFDALLAGEFREAFRRFRKAFDKIPSKVGRYELTERQKARVNDATGLQRTIAARNGLLKELVDQHLSAGYSAKGSSWA